MPGEVSKALRNHHNGQNQEGPNDFKDKKTEGNKSRQAPKTPYVAFITQGQLHALDRDTMAGKVAIQLNKAPTIDTGPKKEVQMREKTNNFTTIATLDKDATEQQMLDWEYLVWLHHNLPMARHPGPKRTLELLMRSTKFLRDTKLTCKIKNYVKAYLICAWGKLMRQKPYRLLLPLPIPSRPWQDRTMDFIVKLWPSKDSSEPENPKYNSIWVVIDWFTRMAYFLPYRENTKADILARQFLKDIFDNHRLPQSIVLNGVVYLPHSSQELYTRHWTLKKTYLRPSTPRETVRHQPNIGSVPLYVLQPSPNQLGRPSTDGFFCI